MHHQQLFRQIFDKNAWDPDNGALLQQVADDYPYFGPAHFYLLKETGIGSPHYAAIAAKAALHFHNPYLLHLQMHQTLPQRTEVRAEVAPGLAQTEPIAETLLTRKSARSADTELLFEPLHTTDYFASLGVKMQDMQLNKDKLGKQLMSFTDWLKTIKRVDWNRIHESADPDLTVEQMAEKSNEEPEVLTESMAEVYQKQGKTKKANEIYKKLSLLNPSKSSYFAAKIESIK